MSATNPAFELVLTGASTPHQFIAFVPDGNGGRAAEHGFEWRTDSTALALDLAALAQAAVAGREPENDLHRVFGRRLYDTVFAGPVSELWQARLKAARRKPLRLSIRIDPTSVRLLLNLPWEYLHDGRDFLALNWRTPLSRLPWGLPAESLGPLDEPLRLLVLIAAPHGLGQNEVLHTALEENVILEALGPARRAGRIEVEFAPNGSLEALDDKLREFDPHMLHFTGHGVFDNLRDSGMLLMETADGRRREVPNAVFAETIERQARSLRLVFLSACQSAVAPRGEGFADLGPRLLEAGIPAVVAMRFSVIDPSAIALGGAFYKGLADGAPLDEVMNEARSSMRTASPNTVDFAVPVLFLADPECLYVDQAAIRAARPRIEPDLTGLAIAQNFAGRAAELRELQTNLDPQQGRWRAAIVHGLGGMGKTVLAARLAERMAPRFEGITSIRVTPTTKAQDILDHLAAFLLVNNARLNGPAIGEFVRAKDQPLPLESKAAPLVAVLRGLRLLVIFDNYEDVLPDGRQVSRGVPADGQAAGVDPDLARLIGLLAANVPGPSRLLFTSRVDFSPLEVGRLEGAVGHLSLGEMQFRDAVYLMETLPPLDTLPVAVLPEHHHESSTPLPRTGEKRSAEGGLQGVRALSMRDLYLRLGGHPYTIGLFARHAARSSAEAVLADLAGIRKELLDFTLLDRAAAALTERARRLLRHTAIYDEPVPPEGLAWMLGDERDAMPPVADETAALMSWGLITRPPGTGDYAVHALVRDWARGQMAAEERLGLLRRAAQFWLGVVQDSRNLSDHLNARHYLFLAGDYKQANDIVHFAWQYLWHWGQIELVLRLLNESMRTLSGSRRTVALGNLATVYRRLGDYKSARQYYEKVMAEFEALRDRYNVAVALHQLGNLHQEQGEYGSARQRYEQSLAIKQELGDRAGIAKSLHQLGTLHQLQGEYEPARQRYEQSLAILQELGDRASIAASLHQLGMLHQQQGKYEAARQRYEQSLAIEQEVGNRAGIAQSLHQLGLLHYLQEEYEPARQRCEQSLAIKQELVDRAGIALSLHLVGMLHQQQGEYESAHQRYEQALAIDQELGDRAGIAKLLGQLGTLFEVEGAYAQAVEYTAQAFAILHQLGSPDREIARRSLAHLRQKMGEAAFNAALAAANVPGLTSALEEPSDDDAEGGMTIEQALDLVVHNTIAVLTSAPEKKKEWWDGLGVWQQSAQAQDLDDFAALCGLLREVVEGRRPAELAACVPEGLRGAWEALEQGLGS